MYQVVLSKHARQDESDGYKYYEAQKQGLGEAFLKALEDCYFRLSNHPHVFGYIDDTSSLRDLKVARFPYLIIYEISGDHVYVYSVHNTYKHPFSNDE